MYVKPCPNSITNAILHTPDNAGLREESIVLDFNHYIKLGLSWRRSNLQTGALQAVQPLANWKRRVPRGADHQLAGREPRKAAPQLCCVAIGRRIGALSATARRGPRRISSSRTAFTRIDYRPMNDPVEDTVVQKSTLAITPNDRGSAIVAEVAPVQPNGPPQPLFPPVL